MESSVRSRPVPRRRFTANALVSGRPSFGRRSPTLRLLALALAAGCAGEPEGRVVVELGGETDALTRAPAVARLVVELVEQDGRVAPLGDVAVPGDEGVELGRAPDDRIAALRVRGLTAGGEEVARGEQLPLPLASLEGASVSVFVQRLGELARMPGPDSFAPAAARATLVAGRYLAATTGTDVALYDLLALRPLASGPTFPLAPASLTTQGLALVAIAGGEARAVDLATGEEGAVVAPDGGAFADVEGGEEFEGDDGARLVVGPTRAATPSVRVLELPASGALAFRTLGHARSGACATFLAGRGLLVAGGSGDAPGAELLATTAPIATALGYPPLGTGACALAALPDGAAALVRGAAVERLEPGCTASCAPTPLAALPEALGTPWARAVGPATVLVGGVGAGGRLRVFALREGALGELTVRAPRGAVALAPLSIGGVALVGGGSGLVERYLP